MLFCDDIEQGVANVCGHQFLNELVCGQWEPVIFILGVFFHKSLHHNLNRAGIETRPSAFFYGFPACPATNGKRVSRVVAPFFPRAS
ncbi:MAG: hypothetical protein ACPG5T_08805 [Endozoicomonas sp.]